MEPDELFQTQQDYTVPLLRLLSELPGGQGRTAEVIRLFGSRHDHRIPDQHRRMRDKYNTMWQYYVHWSRQHLVWSGLVESTRRRLG